MPGGSSRHQDIFGGLHWEPVAGAALRGSFAIINFGTRAAPSVRKKRNHCLRFWLMAAAGSSMIALSDVRLLLAVVGLCRQATHQCSVAAVAARSRRIALMPSVVPVVAEQSSAGKRHQLTVVRHREIDPSA